MPTQTFTTSALFFPEKWLRKRLQIASRDTWTTSVRYRLKVDFIMIQWSDVMRPIVDLHRLQSLFRRSVFRERLNFNYTASGGHLIRVFIIKSSLSSRLYHFVTSELYLLHQDLPIIIQYLIILSFSTFWSFSSFHLLLLLFSLSLGYVHSTFSLLLSPILYPSSLIPTFCIEQSLIPIFPYAHNYTLLCAKK